MSTISPYPAFLPAPNLKPKSKAEQVKEQTLFMHEIKQQQHAAVMQAMGSESGGGMGAQNPIHQWQLREHQKKTQEKLDRIIQQNQTLIGLQNLSSIGKTVWYNDNSIVWQEIKNPSWVISMPETVKNASHIKISFLKTNAEICEERFVSCISSENKHFLSIPWDTIPQGSSHYRLDVAYGSQQKQVLEGICPTVAYAFRGDPRVRSSPEPVVIRICNAARQSIGQFEITADAYKNGFIWRPLDLKKPLGSGTYSLEAHFKNASSGQSLPLWQKKTIAGVFSPEGSDIFLVPSS